jgi:hypothetical protein
MEVEEHMVRFTEPDGCCWHCRPPVKEHHPVGPITMTIETPDETEEHEFCNWVCLGH